MKFFDIHTHKLSSDLAIISLSVKEISEKYNDENLFSVGIHPWFIDEENIDKEVDLINEYSNKKNIVLIGEIGIDKNIETPVNIQKQVFIKQLEIAEKLNKPVIIHCVKAIDELLEIKKKFKIKKWVFHHFSGNIQMANQLIDNGFYLSLSPNILNNLKLIETVKLLPKDKFFIETDNTGYEISYMYENVSKIRNIKIEKLIEQQNENFKNLIDGN